jgi:putative flippase GtrA
MNDSLKSSPAPSAENRAVANNAVVSSRFLRFLIASGVAAGLNFGSRILFSHFVNYSLAIVFAFIIGLSTGFLLNRALVFSTSSNSLRAQMLWFLTINLGALVLTLAVSLLLARIVLPAFGMHSHAEEIAHAVGILAPVLTSYLGHKHLTFR